MNCCIGGPNSRSRTNIIVRKGTQQYVWSPSGIGKGSQQHGRLRTLLVALDLYVNYTVFLSTELNRFYCFESTTWDSVLMVARALWNVNTQAALF